ncbi:MAG: hypothetical protein HOD13_04250 [Rhodospirillaceae bacterium]|nr:hypothetical protein [Rhodospirillaceae bacterium]MBT7730986.1 hypothetical protein [Rhodospirillaceae bacterium]
MPTNKKFSLRVAIFSLLFFGGLGSGVLAAKDVSGFSGIGSVPCSNILMFQNNPVTQKDVTGWVQALIAEINKSAVKKSGGSGIPQVALTPDILWFGTLLYCGLDPAQPLVKASLKLIDAEWDKLKRNARRDS